MIRFVLAFMIFLFSFSIVLSSIASKGEPISSYKWSYNHLDGYVADSGNNWWGIKGVKRQVRYDAEHQKDGQYDNDDYRLKINSRLLFSHGKIQEKTLVADKL